MFYVASKIFWILASPILLLLFVALLGALASRGRFARTAQAFTISAVLLLIFAATAPLGSLLIAPLEDRFPLPSADLAPPDGIIILGGAISGPVSQARNQTTFEHAERLTEAVLLAKRYPNARVIFTGGTGSVSTEAPQAETFISTLGINPARITLEEQSRSTDENARFTRRLIHPEPTQRFLLVTSAYHMPRSMGLFEKAGFKVIAYPAGYRTLGKGAGLNWELDPARNLYTFELAMHEWIGLAAYWATGRIDYPFPGPKEGAA